MQKLTFITGNAGKAKYLSDYFHAPVDHMKLDLKEIQSLNLKDVIEDKAKRAYEIVKGPVIVEDVALTFAELKRLPNKDSQGKKSNLVTSSGFEPEFAP